MHSHIFTFAIVGQIEIDAEYLSHNEAYEQTQSLLSAFHTSDLSVNYFKIRAVNIEEECRQQCEKWIWDDFREEYILVEREEEPEDDEEPHELLREEG